MPPDCSVIFNNTFILHSTFVEWPLYRTDEILKTHGPTFLSVIATYVQCLSNRLVAFCWRFLIALSQTTFCRRFQHFLSIKIASVLPSGMRTTLASSTFFLSLHKVIVGFLKVREHSKQLREESFPCYYKFFGMDTRKAFSKKVPAHVSTSRSDTRGSLGELENLSEREPLASS